MTLDSPCTVGHLVFDNPNSYTVGGGEMLTISGASATTGIEVRSGAHTSAAPVSFTSSATISLASNTGLRFDGSITGAVSSLQLASGATLDVNGNNLVINYTGGSPLAAISSAIASGYAAGQWTRHRHHQRGGRISRQFAQSEQDRLRLCRSERAFWRALRLG